MRVAYSSNHRSALIPYRLPHGSHACLRMAVFSPGHPACSSRHFVRDLFRNVWLSGRDALAGIDSAVLWSARTRWNFCLELPL